MARRKGRARSSVKRVRVATGVSGQRSDGGRHEGEPAGDGSDDEAAAPAALEGGGEAPVDEAAGARGRHAALIWALVATLVAITTVSSPSAHEHGALYDWGRVLVAIGIALTLFVRLLPVAQLRATAPWSLLLMVVGLGAVLGRHVWGFRVFGALQPAELGFPSELAWLALAVGLRQTHNRSAHVLIAFGVGWGLIALCLPVATVGTTRTALGAALSDPMRALFALVLLAALALGAARLAATFLGRELAWSRAMARPLGWMLLALMALSGLASDAPLQALAVTLVFLAIGIEAETVLARRDDAAHAEDGERGDRALGIVVLIAICALWLLLKSHALIASNTDENIYFYMAKLVGDGKLPYQDYFFAHPPLHVMLPGAVFAVFGFSLTLAKLFPLLATLVAGLGVWGIARRSLSPLAAPLALVLYLFAAEVLKASSNMTGVNMTTMWLVLGLHQTLRGHHRRAGVLLAAAVTTGFYAMAPALAICAIAFFFRRPAGEPPSPPPRPDSGLGRGLVQLIAFALVAGGINLIFYALGGDTYLEGVYAYHQEKAFENPDMTEVFGGSPGFPASILHNIGVMIGGGDFVTDVYYHAHLWLGGLALPLVVLAGWIAAGASDPARRPLYRVLFPTTLFRSGPDGRALVIWLVALSLFIELAMFRELYSFYFALVYPFLALCTAYVVQRGIALLAPPTPVDVAAADGDGGARSRRPLIAGALALAGLVVVGLHGAASFSERYVFPDEQQVLGARNAYEWTDPPALALLAGVTREIFWEDHRLRGDFEPGYRHYLWTKKRGFSVLEDVAAHIRTGSAPDETIAGASTLAPLVALLSERRIAADEIDTNTKRFTTGVLSEEAYWNAICADRVRFIVSAPSSYFVDSKLQSLPIIKRAFLRDAEFEDRTLRYNRPFPIRLYRRIDGADCRWP